MSPRYRGLSLTEMLLVLAIGSLLIVTGMRMYSSISKVNDVEVLSENVKMLFSAAANYYYANCARVNKVDGINVPQYATSQIVSLNLADDLNIQPNNLLFSSAVDPSTYVVQYQITAQDKWVSTGIGARASAGKILSWKMQVAVALLLDRSHEAQAAEAERLRTSLNASCYTGVYGTQGGNVLVYECSNAAVADQTNPALNYLSWEEMPSQAKQISSSSFRWFLPNIAVFNQWVQTYTPSLLLNNSSLAGQQYYSCQS